MATFLSILFILICVLLIGVILLQKGRGGGLAGAFGGAGGHSAFGSRTGDMFTWITVVLVALFLLIGVLTVRFMRPPPEKAPVTGAAPGQPTTDANTDIPSPGSDANEPAAPPTPDGTEDAGEVPDAGDQDGGTTAPPVE